MTFRPTLLSLFLLSLLLAVGCSRQQEQQQPLTLTVATYHGDMSTLVLYASESGLFTRHGLQVTLQKTTSGVDAVDAVLQGQADLGTAAEFVFLKKVITRPDLQIFCTINEGQSIGMLALKERGISRPADLRGKRIGVTIGSAAEFHLDQFLAEQGIPPRTVTISDRQPPTMLTGLQDGSLDAVMVWNPVLHQIQSAMPDKLVFWPGQGDQPFHFALVGMQTLPDTKPEALQRFLSVLKIAEQEVLKNPATAQGLTARAIGVSPAQLAKHWGEHDFAVRLNRSLVVTLEHQARWAVAKGIAPRQWNPNILQLINLNPLEQVDHGSVTIIH
jgi:NitT/TauT family transport system substrate-binding protein